LAWATIDAECIQMMMDVTPIRDRASFEAVVDCYSDYKNKWRIAVKAFVEYLIAEDAVWCKIPDHPNFAGQASISRRLARIAKILRLGQQQASSVQVRPATEPSHRNRHSSARRK
jgi:hypothetical protein